MTIQPVEFILANELGFCEGNIIKYTCRYKQKGGIEDLKKVVHYAQILIDKIEKDKANVSIDCNSADIGRTNWYHVEKHIPNSGKLPDDVDYSGPLSP
jgi:hypothetical protein